VVVEGRNVEEKFVKETLDEATSEGDHQFLTRKFLSECRLSLGTHFRLQVGALLQDGREQVQQARQDLVFLRTALHLHTKHKAKR